MTAQTMQQSAYDGNAALDMTGTQAPARPKRVQQRRRLRKPSPAAEPAGETSKPRDRWKAAPAAVGVICLVAAILVLILISFAQMVMVNDQAVQLRSTLSDLKSEETKLMSQYELAYDLQEIEKQMLDSGKMHKAQGWQTYTLELSEPDSVEYYQGSELKEQLASLAKSMVTAVREYF